MSQTTRKKLGFTCAYTPLPIIAAAGFSPYRVLPYDCSSAIGASQFLHDNLCPHIKLVLERAISANVPDELVGMVFINSCDAMRRLKDAWVLVRPQDKVIQLDLPLNFNASALSFFASELRMLAEEIGNFSGKALCEDVLLESIGEYDALAENFSLLRTALREGRLPGGAFTLQRLYNIASEAPLAQAQAEIAALLANLPNTAKKTDSPRVFLMGNVLANIDAFAFFASCGVEVIAEDLCTGSRLFPRYRLAEEEGDIFTKIAHAILTQPACARTFDNQNPCHFATRAIEMIKKSGAAAVIIQTMKFCDPYLARLPLLFESLHAENIPFLFLEGDCSLRSLGQYKTRLEAFVETIQ